MLSADKSSVTAEKREHWELLHMLSVRWSNENFVGGEIRKSAISFLSRAAEQYPLSKWDAVKGHESSVFLALSSDELTELQSSSSGIWAFRLRSASKRFITALLAAPTPSSVSGSRPIAFYRLCFNCRVNIWVSQMQSRRVRWRAGLAAGDVDEDRGGIVEEAEQWRR